MIKPFNPVFIMMLVVVIGIILLLWYLLRNKTDRIMIYDRIHLRHKTSL